MSKGELSELKKIRKLSTENNERLDKLMRQNGILISLLGRQVFTPETIREIVIKRKRDPQKYIEGYNACNGKLTVTQVAKIIGVIQSTLSPILASWEELGIIYDVGKLDARARAYKKLFPI